MDDVMIGLFGFLILVGLLGVAYTLVAIFSILEDLWK